MANDEIFHNHCSEILLSFFLILMSVYIDQFFFSFQCGRKKKITFAALRVFLDVPMIFIYKSGISNLVCTVSLNDRNGLVLTIMTTL